MRKILTILLLFVYCSGFSQTTGNLNNKIASSDVNKKSGTYSATDKHSAILVTTTSITIPSIPVYVPTITTVAIDSITSTTATSGGIISNDGGATVTARGICWNTSTAPTIANSHTTNGTGNGTFHSNLTGLTASTVYHVRAYATNSKGTGYGNELSFSSTGLFDGDALIYFARMSVQPTDALKNLLNTEIVAMKAAGVWVLLDQFVFMNLHDSQASRLDIKNNVDHTWVDGGHLTWVAKVGVTTGNSIYPGNYVNTGFVPSVNGVNYTLNDAGIYEFGTHTVNIASDGCYSTSGGTYYTLIYFANSGGTNNYFNSLAGCVYTGFASGNNFIVRINSTQLIFRTNGVESSPIANNTTGLPKYAYALGGYYYGSFGGQHSSTYSEFGFGTSMDITKRAALEAIINDFNSKVATTF